MLLVIEDKDDPAGGIAVECDGPAETELAYIPAIRVTFPAEPAQVRRDCAVQRMGYEWRRKGMAEALSSAPRTGLVPMYLEAVLRTGWPPFSPAAPSRQGGPEAARLSQKA